MLTLKILNRKPLLFIIGNGGLAAEASHFAAELMGKFGYDVYLPCFSLSNNEALVTALANDIGFENVYSHQLEILGEKGDTLIVLTTSKLSKEDNHSLNLFKAIEIAKKKKMNLIVYDHDNLDGETTYEKQNDCIKKLHKLAIELKEKELSARI